MKAAVTINKESIRIDQVPKPEPKEDEVLVKVLAAGICGGDVRVYNGTFPYLNYPIINGHEFCGIVEGKGKTVQTIKEGDYVTGEPIIPCGHCYACSIGKPNCCSDLKVLGVHVNGCFAEYVCVKADRIYKLPDAIPPEDGCLIEPYGIGLHALHRLALTEEDSLFIIGAGPIGISALDIAKSIGAKVMISDLFEKRLEIAEKMGADRLVVSGTCDIDAAVDEFTGGQKFPAVLEATGVPAVMQSTQNYVANGGRICLAGVTNKTFELSTMAFCNKEVAVYGTRNSYHEFPELIDLFAQKRLHPELMRTHIFSLDDYGEAIKMASKNTSDVCKIVIKVADR
ncbi:MAG: zinc-binding alcohol dehydrogenase family protein [Parasporobacterium sp.]|nr:zinc-binding alcohol dehydrogenase family protein [Parasporobacterium sp.]